MHASVISLIQEAKRVLVIQAENPDGDSLGSSLALEEILSDLGKEVSLYCPVDIPKYLRYFDGWDRVTADFDYAADVAIIVDTAADVLLTKVLETQGVRHYLETHLVAVLDHHITDTNLSFEHTLVAKNDVVATGEMIYHLAFEALWQMNERAASHMLAAMLSDSLGFTTQNVTSDTLLTASKLMTLGASPSVIEAKRREFMKKSAEILQYKGALIQRIEYYLEGKLALVTIPWEEIQSYSDQYNPSMLVLDEMRLVEGVEIGIAIKTYPDGKLTGKLRSNIPISENVAGFFGGGGHKYAAGFRLYEPLSVVLPEIIQAVEKAIDQYRKDHHDTAS